MTITPATISTAQPLAAAAQPQAAPAGPFRRLMARIQALASLSPLSDAQLRDIGLTRSDIDALRGLPLSTDASTRLQIAASRQSGNW